MSCEELTHWKRPWSREGLGAWGEGTTEDEMAGWHHWLHGRESGWTLGVGDGQGGLACCDAWGRKESDTTEQLNWTEVNWTVLKGSFKWINLFQNKRKSSRVSVELQRYLTPKILSFRIFLIEELAGKQSRKLWTMIRSSQYKWINKNKDININNWRLDLSIRLPMDI